MDYRHYYQSSFLLSFFHAKSGAPSVLEVNRYACVPNSNMCSHSNQSFQGTWGVKKDEEVTGSRGQRRIKTPKVFLQRKDGKNNQGSRVRSNRCAGERTCLTDWSGFLLSSPLLSSRLLPSHAVMITARPWRARVCVCVCACLCVNRAKCESLARPLPLDIKR